MTRGNKFTVYDLLKLVIALDLMEENERILDEICDLQEELSRDDESLDDFL